MPGTRSHTCAIEKEKLLELRRICKEGAGGPFWKAAREWMPILIDELLLHDYDDDVAIPHVRGDKETP